jgi:uncharacterized protein
MQNSMPVAANQRLVIVDALKGWALLGVVLLNYFYFFAVGKNWHTLKPNGITTAVFYITQHFFGGKSWLLLSLLFGYGFAMLIDKLKREEKYPYVFFVRRMFWLLVLAIINSAIFFGDILKDYAVLGLLLLVIHKVTPKAKFLIGAVLLLLLPFTEAYVNSLPESNINHLQVLYPYYRSNSWIDVFYFGLKGTYINQIINKPYLYSVHILMFVGMLWGSSLYKIKFFENLPLKLKLIKKTCLLSLVVNVALGIGLAYAKQHQLALLQYFSFRYWLVMSMMLCLSSAICWLYISHKAPSFLKHLSFIGRMTLTNYLMQNLIGLLVFSGIGLGLWNTQPAWFYLLLALTVYLLQIYFSKWWLARYHYGPIEWIWRQLSYGKKLDLKKK